MRARDSGFTLIEILVAFAIMAVTLLSVFQALGAGLKHEHIAEQRNRGVLSARSLVDRLGRDIPISEGRLTGAFATGADWEMTLTRLDLPDGAGASREGAGTIGAIYVTLDVTSPDGRGFRLRTVRPGRLR